MKNPPYSMIAGMGVAIPANVLTNADLERMIDTSDAWIRERTGIEKRHIIEEGRYTSDLCAEAGRNALADAGLAVDTVDLICVATVTGDMAFPSTACIVQEKLGARNASALDIAAACSGFLYALSWADAMIALGRARTVLVIGGETLSRVTDYQDRTTAVLFGDGAGAVLLQPSDGMRGVIDTYLRSDGRFGHLLRIDGLGTKIPPSHESVDRRDQFIKMEGREVFKQAVTAMGDAAETILQRNGLDGSDIDLLIPHQANLRIIDATAKRVNIPPERVFVNIDQYGNTSAASIPIALEEARRTGRLQPGGLALMVAFGSGFTWASALVRF
ncbi:MAG TPA: beta-ketoacyl-ACP synthase III [bacterium]|nr:beta-ketoacyl-ACP synthase III [bacterium]HQG46510.1 beta-ketoacyl-ACP synthase III [bacterium]HQI47516.1 beta-ketoacyl-ACP synthase III [bacterium]HQJ65782.1 beta-ketoacyl-ACP synthase III [bacterium]